MTAVTWSSTGLRLGVDVGGSKIAAVAVDEDGTTIAHSEVPTTPGPDGILAGVLEAVSALTVEHRDAVGVGVGIPGLLDRAAATVRRAINLGIGDEPLPLGERLRDELVLPVVIDSDVTAATWGAHHELGT